jgi:hypothetical protein
MQTFEMLRLVTDVVEICEHVVTLEVTRRERE